MKKAICTNCGEEGKVSEFFKIDSKKKKFNIDDTICDDCIEDMKDRN